MHFYVYNSALNTSKDEKLPVTFSSPDHMHFYSETAIVIWNYLSSCSGQLFMESHIKNRWPLNQGVFQQDMVVFLYYVSHDLGQHSRAYPRQKQGTVNTMAVQHCASVQCEVRHHRNQKSTVLGERAIPSQLAYALMALVVVNLVFFNFPQVPSLMAV